MATVFNENLSSLSHRELGVLLGELEREERVVSKRRSALHERISFVKAGGFASAEPDGEHLAALQKTEHEISERRRVLHRQIDHLRAELGRRAPAE